VYKTKFNTKTKVITILLRNARGQARGSNDNVYGEVYGQS